LSALGGYWLAHFLDASIAGSMAAMAGGIFALVFLLAPERGLVAIARRKARQRWDFAQTMLAIHLFNHEGLPEAGEENRIEHLGEHLRWDAGFSSRVVNRAVERKWVVRENGHLTLTERGRLRAQQALVN
jgi:manganese/zinc/iron transport system permease protein